MLPKDNPCIEHIEKNAGFIFHLKSSNTLLVKTEHKMKKITYAQVIIVVDPEAEWGRMGTFHCHSL